MATKDKHKKELAVAFLLGSMGAAGETPTEEQKANKMKVLARLSEDLGFADDEAKVDEFVADITMTMADYMDLNPVEKVLFKVGKSIYKLAKRL